MALEQRLRGLPRLEGARHGINFFGWADPRRRGAGPMPITARKVGRGGGISGLACRRGIGSANGGRGRSGILGDAGGGVGGGGGGGAGNGGGGLGAGNERSAGGSGMGGIGGGLGGSGRTCGASGVFFAGVGVSIGAPSSGGIPLMMRGRRTSSAGFLSSATGNCPTPIDASRLASTAAEKPAAKADAATPTTSEVRSTSTSAFCSEESPRIPSILAGVKPALPEFFAAAQAYRFVAATGNKPIDGVAKRKHFGGTSHR